MYTEYIIAEDFIMDKYIFDESNGLWYERQGAAEQLKASDQMRGLVLIVGGW